MSKPYRAREFATLAGVTIKALHHYERLGLLKPHRTDAGHRLYTERDLERVEQIIALKFLGLPLKQVKQVLDRGPLPLPEALSRQRQALEDKRRLLDRAIGAIRNAEQKIVLGPPSDVDILQALIQVMAMTTSENTMKKYFSDAAWPTARQYYGQWPSETWRDLFRDVEASLYESSTAHAQLLAARWSALVEIDAGGNPALRAGYMKAWFDREQWPAAILQRVEEFDIERIAQFVSEAAWSRFEVERKQPAGTFRAPDRVSDSRLRLFQDVEAALAEGPTGEQARLLAARWRAILDDDAGDDSSVKDSMLRAWARRKKWPTGMRRYVASLYAMDAATWEKVSDYLEAASGL